MATTSVWRRFWAQLQQRRTLPSWLVAIVCLAAGGLMAAEFAGDFYDGWVRQRYIGTTQPVDMVVRLLLALGLLVLGLVAAHGTITRRPFSPAAMRVRRAGTWVATAGLALLVVDAARGPAHLKSDTFTRLLVTGLHRLAEAESVHYAQHGRFTTDVTALGFSTDTGGWPRYSITADTMEWSATASSPHITRTCSISVRREGRTVIRDGPWCTKRGEYIPP